MTDEPGDAVAAAVDRFYGDRTDTESSRRLWASLLASARRAGARAVVSGRWMADTVVDVAPRIPLRNAATLAAHYPGLGREEVADRLVQTASNLTAGLGFLAGGLIAAQEFLPPSWPAVPFEMASETLLIVAVELKLIGELQALYGYAGPERGQERAVILLRSWMTGRGVNLRNRSPVESVLGPAARQQLTRRLMRRFGRSSTAAVPFLVGGGVAAGLNRTGTRRLAQRIRDDLR